MIMLVFLSLFFIPLLTPLSMSLYVIVLSFFASLFFYSETLSVFPMIGVLLSFSSGMMIMFFYCSMMAIYESKPPRALIFIFFISPFFLFSLSGGQPMGSKVNNDIGFFLDSPLLIFGMVVVLLSMVCINLVIFDPSKSLEHSF